MECKYCGKILATNASLLRHQKTIKYCLILQEKNAVAQFKCDGCGKCLSNKYNLSIHKKTCKVIKETIQEENLEQVVEHLREKLIERDSAIEKLENRIRELELDMKDIALKSKGKTTTNNGDTYVYNNFTPITDEKLKAESINFTKEHLLLGGVGVARFAIEGPLKDNYVVTDISRGNTQYMNEDGKIVIDPCCATLTKRICQSIVEPVQKN